MANPARDDSLVYDQNLPRTLTVFKKMSCEKKIFFHKNI